MSKEKGKGQRDREKGGEKGPRKTIGKEVQVFIVKVLPKGTKKGGTKKEFETFSKKKKEGGREKKGNQGGTKCRKNNNIKICKNSDKKKGGGCVEGHEGKWEN